MMIHLSFRAGVTSPGAARGTHGKDKTGER